MSGQTIDTGATGALGIGPPEVGTRKPVRPPPVDPPFGDPPFGVGGWSPAERDRLDDQRCRIERILDEGRVSAEMQAALRLRLGQVYLQLWAMANA